MNRLDRIIEETHDLLFEELSPDEVARRLNKAGWREEKGKQTSHRQFSMPGRPDLGKVAVPGHGKVRNDILRKIEKQSGVKLL